jgi:hypothetical protein
MSTAIPRMNLETLATIDDPRVSLAKEAQTKLGYNRLALAIAVPSALLFGLRQLGIEPLVTQRVRDYKRSKETTGWYSGTKQTVLAIALAALSIAALVTGMTRDFAGQWTSWHYGINTLLAAFVLVSAPTAFYRLAAADFGHGTRRVRKWDSSDLESYEGNVPEFVLAKAVQIKTALPDTLFAVEYLIEESQSRRRPEPDPFLVAKLGNERYYIDVWNEKEYEARL